MVPDLLYHSPTTENEGAVKDVRQRLALYTPTKGAKRLVEQPKLGLAKRLAGLLVCFEVGSKAQALANQRLVFTRDVLTNLFSDFFSANPKSCCHEAFNIFEEILLVLMNHLHPTDRGTRIELRVIGLLNLELSHEIRLLALLSAA